MFPKWDNDIEDVAVKNIIQVMFNAPPSWKWTMNCWEDSGTNPLTNPKTHVVCVKEVSYVKSLFVREEVSERPSKKARIKALIEPRSEAFPEARSEASIPIKLLGNRLEAVEKKLGITGKGTTSDDLQLTTSSLSVEAKEKELKEAKEKEVKEKAKVALEKAKEAKLKEAKEKEVKEKANVNLEKALAKPKEAKAKVGKEAKAKEAKEDGADIVLSTAPEASAEASVVLMDKDKDTVSIVQRQETKRLSKSEYALEVVRARSERDRKFAASQQSPFQGNNTAKVIIPNTKFGHGYDPFALPKKQLSKAFLKFLKKDLHWRKSLECKPKGCLSYWYQVIRTPLEWLLDKHMDAYINSLRLWYKKNPNHFRSERMCFLDHVFSRMWTDKYMEFKSSTTDQNGLGRRLPGGSWDFYAGIILIPQRHIVVWDNIVKHISPPKLDEVMEHFLTMIPYLLVECTSSDEERIKYSLEPFTYERVTIGVPQCRVGDCGVYPLSTSSVMLLA
ncbi:hypothetical protein N665_1930s0003 [Sinapis alba]|nr:hypothetical protein N665_1930s0003 [Sinapis alba]